MSKVEKYRFQATLGPGGSTERGNAVRMPRFARSAFTATVAAVGMVMFATTPAQASTNITVHVGRCPMDYCATAGYGWFNADPIGSTPGDALKACDLASDGYYIKAWLTNRDTGKVVRTASTAGHNANYCTGWQTGDLPEQTRVWLEVCKMSGTRKVLCEYGSEGWA
ncbi:hypothetical protein [Streptomyces sp. NPDC090021]|uniref:hypothetical protein n=1 Tax=Streptomyces sp. NPDC090021 TaxID=3365919 RepID=UPI0037F32776